MVSGTIVRTETSGGGGAVPAPGRRRRAATAPIRTRSTTAAVHVAALIRRFMRIPAGEGDDYNAARAALTDVFAMWSRRSATGWAPARVGPARAADDAGPARLFCGRGRSPLQVFGEPLRGSLPRFVDTGSRVDRIVAAVDLHQAFGLASPREGLADRFRRRDHIVSGEDHQQRTWRNQVDESTPRVFHDRVERAHGDFVAPGRGARGKHEVIALLILLQREALARPRRAWDVAFATFDNMADAFLNGELL